MKSPKLTPAPDANLATNLMLQQFQQSQAQSLLDQQAFKDKLAAQQQTDLQSVNAQTSNLQQQTAAAATKPVDFKTILTSPSGLLGNPLLSYTKLGS